MLWTQSKTDRPIASPRSLMAHSRRRLTEPPGDPNERHVDYLGKRAHNRTMSAVVAEKGGRSSAFVLMEGVLEKLKEREFPWILSGRKLSTTWILRYYVLRHADIPDPEAFLLEQLEDCRPFSKVRKTLDLRRVVQVDTNISLKVGSQNWILAIHYKSKHGKKLKVLYLAAHSEAEMNSWIAKFCYACKLEKQGDDADSQPDSVEIANESTVMTSPRSSRYVSDSSVVPRNLAHAQVRHVDSSGLQSIENNTSSCNYVNPVTTHAYIRLKDCSSTRSLGSSSASLSSSVTTSSSTTPDHSAAENVSSKNLLRIPPPIPPKPSPGIRMKKNRNDITGKGISILDHPLTPPDIGDVLTPKEDWSNETIRLDTVRLSDADADATTPLPTDSVVPPAVSVSTAPKPLPRCRGYRNIPPEVDRSCKPIRKNRNPCFRIDDACGTSPRIFSTHPHQLHIPSTREQNKQVVIGQESLYGNGLMDSTDGVLDYLDPLEEPTVQSSLPAKSSQRPKISCATEYTQIDEESTKAVMEANSRQDEIRRKGFSV